MSAERQRMVELDPPGAAWERCFTVFPLVVVGTVEVDGSHDLAPKHMAMPVSWEDHFGFVCSSRHATYHNVVRTGQFTVTYVRPDQTVLASLAASPRDVGGDKPIVRELPTVPARRVEGIHLANGVLMLECELDRIIDDLGPNALIIGRVVAARVAEDALRQSDVDDQDVLFASPLLAYVSPGRFGVIDRSYTLPFPAGFRR